MSYEKRARVRRRNRRAGHVFGIREHFLLRQTRTGSVCCRGAETAKARRSTRGEKLDLSRLPFADFFADLRLRGLCSGAADVRECPEMSKTVRPYAKMQNEPTVPGSSRNYRCGRGFGGKFARLWSR